VEKIFPAKTQSRKEEELLSFASLRLCGRIFLADRLFAWIEELEIPRGRQVLDPVSLFELGKQ
jgi:hypothetical protein